MPDRKPQTFVLSLGGSIVSAKTGVDIEFLKQFNLFIRHQISEKNRRFFIVVGGGTIVREYQQAATAVENHHITYDDLDWLGIHGTHLNGHLLRTIFRDIAFKYVIIHYERRYQIPDKYRVIIGAGWKPGRSTDYDAVLLCQYYHIKTIINLTNTDMIYNKDPKKFKDAEPIKSLTWRRVREIVGDKWAPGLNAPFDPIAAAVCEKLKLTAITLDGKNLDNFSKCLDHKPFVGTTIHP
jgi:uridylate kinase